MKDLVDMLDALTAQFMPAEDPSMIERLNVIRDMIATTCLDSLR